MNARRDPFERAAWRCEAHSPRDPDCRDCSVAMKRVRAARRGLTAYVSADTASHYVRTWFEAGYSQECIAAATGIDQGAVSRMVNGTKARIQRVRHERVLRLTERELARFEVLVPACGAARRFQHLAVMGWTLEDISELVGWSTARIWHVRNGRTARLPKRDHDHVAQAFRRRWTEQRDSKYARTTARNHGWVSILAWDDPDDPNDVPNVGTDIEEAA